MQGTARGSHSQAVNETSLNGRPSDRNQDVSVRVPGLSESSGSIDFIDGPPVPPDSEKPVVFDYVCEIRHSRQRPAQRVKLS